MNQAEKIAGAPGSIPVRRDWTGSAYRARRVHSRYLILQRDDRSDPDRRRRGAVRVDDADGFWRWQRLGDAPGLRNPCAAVALFDDSLRRFHDRAMFSQEWGHS